MVSKARGRTSVTYDVVFTKTPGTDIWIKVRSPAGPAAGASITNFTHPFPSASRLGFPQAAHCTDLAKCQLDADDFYTLTKKNDNSTKPAKASKYADDINFVSCKMWPNLKPRVGCADDEVKVGDESYNVVEWKLPKADIVLDKKYSFTIKLKFGSEIEDTDKPYVVFTTLSKDTAVDGPDEIGASQFLPIAIK